MRQAKPSDAPLVAAIMREASSTGFATAAADEVDEAKVAAMVKRVAG